MTSRRVLPLLVPLALAFMLAPSAARAAGSALSPLVHDIGLSLLASGALALVFTRFKIPSVAAFIVAGIVIGPLLFALVTDPESIDTIAQIGFILLLFVIGLEIDAKSLFASNKAIIRIGLAQYPLALLFGFILTHALILMGIGGEMLDAPLAPFYIGAVIAGSSSLLVVKLFQENFELDTQPGHLALAVLIFQDIWSVIFTLVQSNLEHPNFLAILYSFLGIALLIGIAGLGARFLAPIAFRWISKVPELILLVAISWCFAVIVVGTNLDDAAELFGLHIDLSVGAGMAALIAGATIASLPFSKEVVSKVGLVKDFFVTLFFVGLGISIPMLQGWSVPILGVLIALMAILSRQLVFFPLFYWLGIDQRTAEVTTIRLSQISEFGLVITFLGIEEGHIGRELGGAIILAFIFTAVLTSPLYARAYDLYERVKPLLTRLGFAEPAAVAATHDEGFALAILGVHRDASSLLSDLAAHYPRLLAQTVVVDFNVAMHPKIRATGAHVEYGDIANSESLVHAGVDRAKVILCTISDDILRGISNEDLVRTLRRLNPNAVIIANAVDGKSWQDVYDAGADYVYMARVEVAHALGEAVRNAMNGTLAEYKAAQLQKSGTPQTRQEVIG